MRSMKIFRELTTIWDLFGPNNSCLTNKCKAGGFIKVIDVL